ncbi:Gfo/Idh/MocA family oxidoreductase [Flavihumibacter sp. CACIAM 22H1]|uniref:Gfo/Idh/MocA family oxidoreductase n=1 Tax=Flavihumibacter sp. CACIAM 22H1 TaxID=1812911 RepID=UPI0007A8B3F3|nr:Gfo/Idh/MocA family oxidoreductase [Flavihumibacter sp. CACIAM 22H1]KYP13901.1 MAG: oxidoreductase [Flavihumibacter sp. CACIAM 22H1]
MRVINTGICSFGMSGKLFHAPFLDNHPGFELTAIVERHNQDSRARYGHSKLVRSFEDLLSDDSIELIVVNTPTQTHYDFTKLALEAGKHVVVEKPVTTNAAEAVALDQLAKDKNLHLIVYQNRRYDGDYRAIKNVVEKGLLGEIREVEFRYDRYRTEPSGKAHKEKNLPGAGILHDLGSHLTDQTLQLFGWPQAVFADIMTLRDQVESNDYFELLLFYPRMRVRLKGTVVARETVIAFVLQGMNGTFMQERSDLQEAELLKGTVPSVESWCPAPSKPDGLLHSLVNGQVLRQETTSAPGNYMEFYTDVYNTLVKGAPNPVPVTDAIKTMTILDAAQLSHKEKRVVPV